MQILQKRFATKIQTAIDSFYLSWKHVCSIEMNFAGFRLLHLVQTLKQNPNECNITIVGLKSI